MARTLASGRTTGPVRRRARRPDGCVAAPPVTTEGPRELGFAPAAAVEPHRGEQPHPEPTRVVLRPTAVDDAGFTVERDPEVPGGFIVRGERPLRWVRQTNSANAEAVGYLADRLGRLGVEEQLAAAGATPGCAVTIGSMTFDWEPSTPAGIAAVRMVGRGEDPRIGTDDRIGAAARKEARRLRRGPAAEEPDGAG